MTAPTNPGGPPVLLTGLTAAAVLDGRGDLELFRETRGATVDWGGVYAQLVRLTGAWRIGLVVDGKAFDLVGSLLGTESPEEGWTSHHRCGRLEVLQDLAVSDEPPGVVRRLRLRADEGPPIRVVVENRFEPYLLPVLVEGIRPTSFRVETSHDELRIRQRGFGLAFRSSVPPSHLFLNRASWIGGRFEGPVTEFGSDHPLEVAAGAPVAVGFLLTGGLERELARRTSADAGPFDPEEVRRHRAQEVADWMAETPELSFPEAPELEAGYRSARRALRRLYAAPGDGLFGLVAGYPWYSAIWCRDLAWMLPAVRWLGDFDWFERSVASVLRFQSHSEVPILGGEPGELPMQIAPGPIFLYGTSDTTLYYPALIARFIRHAGRTDLASSWTTALARMVAWGRARTDPASGLLRNGGEAESISAATGSLAKVRYGIDSPDTTIWDSADRRDHAIDVQVLWWEALRAAAELLRDGSEDPRGAADAVLAERLAQSIRTRYAWPEEEYLFDSLRAAGPVAKVRPNALRAVSAGLLSGEFARRVVHRAARDDLSTDWGVRTLSARDPGYDPLAYHDGEVWTIATAWAAEAALAVGEPELGVEFLARIARRFREEGGWANECYRGDRAEAYNSCFLLGFSVAPFLTVLFERLWGLSVEGAVPRVTVRPLFPSAWRSASLRGLRVGPGRVSLGWEAGSLRAEWSGPGPLELCAAGPPVRMAPGSSATIPPASSTAKTPGPPKSS